MSAVISMLQLPRLCIWTSDTANSPVISGVGPHLEVYDLQKSGEYRLVSRTSVFGACGRPVTSIMRIQNSDSFVVVGSSLMCILRQSELREPVVPSSRIHSFTDEIINIAYAVQHKHHCELGLILRSGRTICVRAAIDDTNRLRVEAIAEYDRAKCGLLMSALCLIPARSAANMNMWKDMRCIAGSAMGEVRLWRPSEEAASRSTKECGRIGFVISMTVVDECEESGQSTVLAVTENRAMNLWRIKHREPEWLSLLHKEEVAHSVRPSALTYCSRMRIAVSAAEDGELGIWSIAETDFCLLRRFQTRVGAVRSLTVDGDDRIVYGSMTGSLFSLPIASLVEQPSIHFIEGHKLREQRRDCDRTPIRTFAVVHHHDKFDDSVAPGTYQTELQALGEDGSSMAVMGDAASEWVDNEGSYHHLNSWTDRDSAITVFHNELHVRISSYHPRDHLSGDNTGYTVLSERSHRSTILTARPTMSRGEKGAEPYVVLQSTDGIIALIRECFGEVRIWRFRIIRDEIEMGEGKKSRQNEKLIVNTVAIDRSSQLGLHVVLGTTNGRLLYALLRGEGEQTPEGECTLDFALDKQRSAECLIMYPRSRRLEKTSITQLEYCMESRESMALSKNGWLMRIRVDEERGLVVSEEEISRELGVEWPIRIERRGTEEYVVGFNARNLVVVSRRLKTCLLSIDCGGELASGHRQVHVDLYEDKKSYGIAKGGCCSQNGGIDRITVYYVKQQGIVRHSQRLFTTGLRQLAWTPHRDKLVFCTGTGPYVLTGSIDGEIVLGNRDYDSLSVRLRWYVPETTVACVARKNDEKNVLRFVIGGHKGDLHAAEWNEEERSFPPLTTIKTGNGSRVIDVCVQDDHIVAAFADAQIAIFHVDWSAVRARRVATWEMPVVHRSTFTKVCVRVSKSHGSRMIIDAITSAGTLTRLQFDAVEGTIEHLRDFSIDAAALTAIRHDQSAEITVIGSDSGALFVYKDTDEDLDLLEVWRDANTCQITDLALFRSPTNALRMASVGMDCTITVLETGGATGEFSLVRQGVFAVNDPSSILMISESGETTKAIVAGCGMEIVHV